MKRIFGTLIILLFSTQINAQVEAEIAKNFRIGLKATPNLGWLAEDKNTTERNGMSLGFGYGLQTEFRLSSSLSFVTGLEVDYMAGGINYISYDSTKTNPYNSSVHLMITDTDGNVTDTMQIMSRKYGFNMVTIPLTIKGKTKEIGYLTYWGQFGFNASYLYKARASKNSVYENNLQSELDGQYAEIDVLNETNPLRLGLTLGFGAEYNLFGSTNLLFGINYNKGITNTLKKDSRSLLDNKYNNFDGGLHSSSALQQIIKSDAVVLTVGILF